MTPAQISTVFGINNVIIPVGGPKCAPFIFDFSSESEYVLDGELLTSQHHMEYVQGFWVDNSQNANSVLVHVSITNQVIEIPPRWQGYFPVLSPNPPKFTISTTAVADLMVTFFFYNVPIQANSWPTTAQGSSGVTIAGPSVAGSDGSDDGSFALDGSSQELFAAGAAAHYLLIQNPTGNGNLTVNIAGGDAAASGVVLTGGGSLEIQNGVASAITVKGTNAETIQAFAG